MIDMSDDEADTIVVAMAAPNGPLGDSFEVDVAAGASRPNSHAKTPRKQKPTARRKPTTKSPSVASRKSKSASTTNSPAPSAKSKRTTNHSRNDSSGDSVPYSHSPSPSLATATNTTTSNSATSTANSTPTNRNSSIANAAAIAAAQNTRLVRIKKQLCNMWDIESADLNATFNSANIVDGPLSPSKSSQEPSLSPSSKSSKSSPASRDFFAKLARMAQMTDVSFDVAKVELERAREERLKGGVEGTFGAGEEAERSKDKTFLWVPEDVDKATDLIIMAKAKARAGGAVSKKRTASQAGASEERARPPPAERARAQAKETEAGVQKQGAAQKGRPPPVEVQNGFVGEMRQGLLTPTDEMDIRSERASVPRASSIEAMIEAQRNNTPQVQPIQSMQPQPRPQPAVVIGPARAQATTPSQAPPETTCLQPSPQFEKKAVTGAVPAIPQARPAQSQPQPQRQAMNGSAQVQATPSQMQPSQHQPRQQPDPKTKEVAGAAPAQSTPSQARPMQSQSQPLREMMNGPARAQATASPTQPAKSLPQPHPNPKWMGVTGVVSAQSTLSHAQPQLKAVSESVQTQSTPPQAQNSQPQRQPDPITKWTAGAVRPQQIPSQAPPAAQSQTHSGHSPKAATPAARTDPAPSQAHPQAAAVSETARPKSTPSQTPYRPPPVEVPARREQSTPLQAPSSPALRQSESPGGTGERQAPDLWSTRQRMDLSTLTHPTQHAKVGPVRPSTASPTVPRPQPLPQSVSNGVVSNSPVSGAAVMDRRMSDGAVWKGAGQYGVVSNGTIPSNWVPNSPKMNAPMPNAPMPTSVKMSTPMTNGPIPSAPIPSAPIPNAPVPNAPMPNAPMQNTPMPNSPMSNAPMVSAPVSNSPRTKTPLSSIPMFKPPVSNSPVQRSPKSNAPASDSPVRNATVPNATSSNGPASNSTASGGVPNRVVSTGSNGPTQRPVGLTQAGGQSASSREVAHPKALAAGAHAEALRRLENDQTLPPPVFDHILQMFCSVSALHVAVAPVTSTAKTASHPSFLLLQYNVIIVPFYIDNSWSLATLNLELKAMIVCGPRTEQLKTESAAISFFNASLDGADHTSWKKTYISLGPPANYWDQPIVCLVAAIHMFCGLDLPNTNPDPTIWRSVLAILLKGLHPGSTLAPRPTSSKDDGNDEDADVDPANFAVPPTCCPLPMKNYLAHMSKALAAFHARHQERLTEVRGFAAHSAHTKILFALLVHPVFLSKQHQAYKTRQAEMQALVEQTENMMQTLTRMKLAIPGSATINELMGCIEGARAVQAADTVRVDRLERLTTERESVGGMVSAFVEKVEKRERRLEERWAELWGKMEGEFGGMAAVFGPPRGGSGGGGEKRGKSGAKSGGTSGAAGASASPAPAAGTGGNGARAANNTGGGSAAGGTAGGGNCDRREPQTHWAAAWRPAE